MEFKIDRYLPNRYDWNVDVRRVSYEVRFQNYMESSGVFRISGNRNADRGRLSVAERPRK